MNVRSMTGYGFAELEAEDQRASVEIKTYNNRYSEVNVNLHPSLGAFEQAARDYFRNHKFRGKVDVYARWRSSDSSMAAEIDMPLLTSLHQKLNAARRELKIKQPLSMADLLKVDGVVRVERQRLGDQGLALLSSALEQAWKQVTESRTREGAALLADVQGQLGRIRTALETVRGHAAGLEDQLKADVTGRFNEVLGNGVDEQRVLTEVAVLLMRYTIHEELSRIDAHLGAFDEALAEEGPKGKRLDFLCQELNREINTIGSKSQKSEVAASVVEMKDALENVREQCKNME